MQHSQEHLAGEVPHHPQGGENLTIHINHVKFRPDFRLGSRNNLVNA
jgi:hypothetical protein